MPNANRGLAFRHNSCIPARAPNLDLSHSLTVCALHGAVTEQSEIKIIITLTRLKQNTLYLLQYFVSSIQVLHLSKNYLIIFQPESSMEIRALR